MSRAATFKARLEVAHFGAAELPAGPVRWSLKTDKGRTLASGQLATKKIRAGAVAELGEVTIPLLRRLIGEDVALHRGLEGTAGALRKPNAALVQLSTN